jgi:hypothetical protein
MEPLLVLGSGLPCFLALRTDPFQRRPFLCHDFRKKWKIVRKFIRSEKLEQLVTLEVPLTAISACTKRKLDTRPVRLRLIRVELESGETEVLITSLTDMEQYPRELFADLYHERWSVEGSYKVMKCRIEIENFTGQSELSVYQDFHACVLSHNITAMLANVAQDGMEQTTDHRRLPYKINFTPFFRLCEIRSYCSFTKPRTCCNRSYLIYLTRLPRQSN